MIEDRRLDVGYRARATGCNRAGLPVGTSAADAGQDGPVELQADGIVYVALRMPPRRCPSISCKSLRLRAVDIARQVEIVVVPGSAISATGTMRA